MSAPDTSAAFFDAMFRDSTDPWNFAADAYEQFRYNAIVQALQPGPYRCAFEPGCSVGALTEKLALLCKHVDAYDFSPAAVEQARTRCRALPGVTVRCTSLADTLPRAEHDLVVLSEIGYYFTSTAWQSRVSDIVAVMLPGATLLASHWLGSSPDHLLSGDEVHRLIEHPTLQLTRRERFPDAQRGGFRLDQWSKQL